MFAKKHPNGRDVGQTRSDRTARPVSLPSFMRSDPDGQLLAMLKRVKAASSKPKLPTGRNRRERVNSQPVTDEYVHVKPVVNSYRRPFRSPVSKQMGGENFWSDVPPVPRLLKNCDEMPQDASTTAIEGVGYGILAEAEVRENVDADASSMAIRDDLEAVECQNLRELEGSEDYGEESPYFQKYRCRKSDVDSVFTAGIAKVQLCKTTPAVFEEFRETFHNILECCTYEAETTNSVTQTSAPKLQRSQMNLVYAGPWESCTWKQHRGMQTAMLLQNSSGPKPNWVKKMFGWKSFGMTFLMSAVFLGLMEIPNHF